MNGCLKSAWLFALVIWLLFHSGCSTANKEIKAKADMPPPCVERSEFLYHRVMAGETMASIAKWYSGKENQWRKIAEHNPSMNPWRLQKDDIVKVPVVIATVHTEQPITSTAPPPKPRKTKAAMKVKKLEQQQEEPLLEEEVFGPR